MLDLKRTIDSSGFSQAGLPLDVSPALVAELKANGFRRDGKIARKIRALIGKAALPEKLSEITVINGSSDEGQAGLWNFIGGQVIRGHWVPQAIPRVGTEKIQQTDNLGLIVRGMPQSAPLSPQDTQIAAAVARPKDPKTASVVSEVEQILNPQRANPRNTDCASCHLASVAEARLKEGMGPDHWMKSEPFGFFKSPLGVTAFAAEKSAESDGDDGGKFGFNNVHVIGYMQDSSVVTSLVAKSAGLVAQQLNQILNLPNPGTVPRGTARTAGDH